MKKRFSSILKILGVIMLLLIVCCIGAAIFGINYLMNQNNIPQNAILEIKFYDDIPEKSTSLNFIHKYFHNQESSVSMREVVQLLEQAKNDKSIKALLINGESLISHSKAAELHDIIEDFKIASEKPVYAYGNNFRQSAYLSASAADSIILHPLGGIDLKGYAIIFTYFKDFLDRYDLDMEIFRAGKFKSYVESYTRNAASEESTLQFTEILGGFQLELIDQLVIDRGISKESVVEIIQTNGASRATECISKKLIDKIEYETDFRDRLLERYGKEESGFIDLGQYKKHLSCSSTNGKVKVAYLPMSGTIGEYTADISSSYLQKTFKSIRDDKEIKTLLIRMDSGGGSAFASEDIWHEIELCKEAGIEIITSVSSMAGSGGYYVIANSDKIFANKNSIVGSIGVFIAIPIVKNALEKHVGIHFDEITTGPFAARIKGINNLTPQQKEYYTKSAQDLYNVFKERVAKGRNLDFALVDSIAQGRIYTAEIGLGLGLVDSLIDLHQTMEYIKNKHEGKELQFVEFQSNEEEYFGKFEVTDLIKMGVGKDSQMARLSSESINEFSTLISDPTPQARVDFFRIKD